MQLNFARKWWNTRLSVQCGNARVSPKCTKGGKCTLSSSARNAQSSATKKYFSRKHTSHQFPARLTTYKRGRKINTRSSRHVAESDMMRASKSTPLEQHSPANIYGINKSTNQLVYGSKDDRHQAAMILMRAWWRIEVTYRNQRRTKNLNVNFARKPSSLYQKCHLMKINGVTKRKFLCVKCNEYMYLIIFS